MRQKSVSLEVDETGRTIFSEPEADNLFVAAVVKLKLDSQSNLLFLCQLTMLKREPNLNI